MAKNRPISSKQIKKQLIKTDNLPIYIEDIKINYSGNLFAPLSQINEFRRNFFNNLKDFIIESYKPKDVDITATTESIINNKFYNSNDSHDKYCDNKNQSKT